MNKVIVLGGGVAGLTAAHELAQRGFAVTVYERRRDVIGGKARTEDVPGATAGRRPLPGEHGFRFFPGFYKHVPDTMSRIPVPGQPRGVFDNLVPAPRGLMAVTTDPPFEFNMRLPQTWSDWKLALAQPGHMAAIGLTASDMEFFSGKLLGVMTECQARRYVELDVLGWWQFMDADARSAAFRMYLATGLTRNAVASQAQLANARTIASIGTQLMLNMTLPGEVADRVLTGPTTQVWLEPWRRHLVSLGVEFHHDATVTGLEFDGRRVTGVTVIERGASTRVTADAYVCALPLDVVPSVLPESLLRWDPSLSGLPTLSQQVNWMTGVQYYLDYDPPLVAGHINCIDSPWAVTAISQKQFWPSLDLSQYGDGTTRGIVSVDISNWTAPANPGGPANGKCAKDCTKDEIAAEAWRQLVAGLSGGGTPCALTTYTSYWLDDDILFTAPDGRCAANLEPLLVNNAGSWQLRPDAATHVENLVMAGDYVRTWTDFASMEAANEAARRAVNALLPRFGYTGPDGPCQLWPLHEPDVFAPFRAIDMERFAKGEPWVPPDQLPRTALDRIEQGMVHIVEGAEHVAAHVGQFLKGLTHGFHTDARRVQEEQIDGIFARNRGRANPLPSGDWATFQTWRNLLFAHWPVPASVVRPHVPEGLDLDLFDGQAYASLVAMEMAHICFRTLGTLTATIPGETSFPELNVRTYVRCNGRQGVYFLRADAQALIADLGARMLFHMPYGPATMSLQAIDTNTWSFRSHRTMPPTPDATYAVRYTPTGTLAPVGETSRTAFLRNRDYAYLSRDGQILSLGLLHDPWQAQTADVTVQVNTVLAASGFELPSTPLYVDYTPEIQVVLWSGEPVR